MAVKNHSAAAVAASLKMKKQLKLKSRSFGNNYIPEINIKCGIHTDHVLIGNIGCSKRMKYGIMGDGVNLASRIESLTRRYSADIIISNNVFVNKEVQKRFVICPLDVVVVQGKSNPTVIYHVLNTVNDSDPISLLKSKFHTKALIFFINKDFKRSLFYIEKINKLEPFKNDLSTISLSNKCKQFQDTKLDFNWSCAEVLKKKYFNE
ncbi:adenylate cyclase [Cryptosporidium hominis TU502]|nr:adenylate cyclase [Cryptosporidium hominis TU502]